MPKGQANGQHHQRERNKKATEHAIGSIQDHAREEGQRNEQEKIRDPI